MSQTCPICRSSSVQLFSKAQYQRSEELREEYSVIRCSDCSFAWTDPRPGLEDLAKYYPTGYFGDISNLIGELKADQLRKSSPWRMELDKVRILEKWTNGGKILDVGCGPGQFLLALDQPRWLPEGIEQDEVASYAIQTLLPELRVWNGNIEDFQGKPNSYDVITFWHSLEHVTQPREVLEKAHSLLCNGGHIIISVPNFDSLQAKLFRKHWYALDVPRHLWHFSPRALEILLNETGFEVETHVFFSKAVNFHQWKHSMRALASAATHSLIPYYFLKPLLHLLPFVERLTGKWGVMTFVAHKSQSSNTQG